MKNLLQLFIFCSFLMSFALTAQNRTNALGGGVKGKVIESAQSVPMEFANVVLFNSSDSSQAGGTVTNYEGEFEILRVNQGNYYIRVGFIGFQEKVFDNIRIKSGNIFDLETIVLEPQVYDVNDVVVSGERAPISYEIDKKVINVSEQISAISGSAVDILENVPSVTVDIEGNVSLRGSSNFNVLIDGRPSVLDANDALQQIPASSIENIEIITNPSAKYNPEGTAGIINIVLKKNERAGMSGIVEVNGGSSGRYGGEVILDYKTKTLDLNFSADYNKRIHEIDRREENITTFNNITSYLNSNGLMDRGSKSYGFRGEIGFHLSDNDVWTFGGRWGDRSHESNSSYNYSEWTNDQAAKSLYLSSSIHSRSGDFYAVYSRFYHKFETKGHEFSAEIYHDSRNGDEYSINELLDNDLNLSSGQKNTEKGPGNEYRIKADYILPLGGESKFEAGYQSEFEFDEEETGYYEFDTAENDYKYFEEFSNDTKYDEITHSVYSLFSDKVNEFGYQLGLRAEYTYRDIEVVRSSETFSVDRWDFFPTLHLSYKIGGGNQMMGSYTRRIDRPRGWELEPFYTWMDAYNVRVGNPSLLPEFIDSYELGYQTLLGKSVFSIEAYYRVTKNKIERVRSVFEDNVTLRSTENVGKDYSFGTELMLNFDPVEFWNTNLMGNLYNYKVEGRLFGNDFSRESFNWNIRFNNVFSLWEETKLQLNTFYNSPTVDSQGEREGFFMVSLGIRKDFFDNLLSATLQVRDVFSTAKYEVTNESPNYFNYIYGRRESPMVMLNLKFNINSQKKEQNRGRNGESDGGGLDGGDDF